MTPPTYRTPADWHQQTPRILDLLDTPWHIGDWLAAAYRLDLVDNLAQVVNRERRFDPGQTAELCYVAERYPTQTSRRRRLPHTYYTAAARLPPLQAQAALADATKHNMSLTDLRKHIKAHTT